MAESRQSVSFGIGRIASAIVLIVVIVALIGVVIVYVNPGSPGQTTSSSTSAEKISFLPGSVSLCPSNCGYPSPYLSGTVIVNSTVPLRTLQLYINGTFESTSSYSNNLTNYAIQYKANPTNQSMPIVSGKAYLISMVGTFQDNSKSNASTVVIASSTSTQTGQPASSDLVCSATTYQVLGFQSISVQNGTTQTLGIRTMTSTVAETTYTTTTNVTQSVGYVTTTTNYIPPSAWSETTCTYVG